MVKHVQKQALDHYLLVLDTNSQKAKEKRRFCFDKRWVSKLGIEEVIKK